MASYHRIVSYVYKYADGKKGENVGFVRVETKDEGMRFQIHLRDLKEMDEKKVEVYFYFHKEDEINTIFVDEISYLRGNCEYKKMISREDLSVDVAKMDGVLFCNDDKLLYGSCWDEREIVEDKIVREKMDIGLKSSELEGELEEVLLEERQEEPVKAHLEAQAVLKDSKLEQLLHTFSETIVLKDNPEFIRSVKIDVDDIAKLSYKDWKLAENTFVRQGYEAYGYLMFGKIKFQQDQTLWILGVPGIYDNREKYLAAIFGFFDYIPEEDTKFRTGGRGYWITRLNEME